MIKQDGRTKLLRQESVFPARLAAVKRSRSSEALMKYLHQSAPALAKAVEALNAKADP